MLHVAEACRDRITAVIKGAWCIGRILMDAFHAGQVFRDEAHTASLDFGGADDLSESSPG